MDWPSCGTPYNQTSRMPRIIIKCGHSLWEKWLRKIVIDTEKGNSQICPECKTKIQYDAFVPFRGDQKSSLSMNELTQIVEWFPKNLALLKSQPNEFHVSPIKNWYFYQDRQASESQETGDSWHKFWNLHPDKYVEAFCSDDKVLLCLECILANSHRGHEISSIDHGYAVQKAQLEEFIWEINDKQSKLILSQDSLRQELIDLIELDQQRKESIDLLFQAIK
jgi:hypothetical protein